MSLNRPQESQVPTTLCRNRYPNAALPSVLRLVVLPLLSSGKNWQQPQQRVPVTWIPMVLMRPLRSGVGLHQQWGWSIAQ